MQNQQQSDRLSWGDTVFLHLEREGMPLNVASVSVLEGTIPFEDCLRFIESKLPLIPRYYKRLVAPPLNIGLPSWEYDPNFDIRNHVREATLKHGTDSELKALAGKLFSTVMDRQHPLWDITFVQGLKGNCTGLILRLHHCLADGIAGVGIMGKLLDTSPDAPLLPRKKFRLRVPPRDAINSLLDGVVSSYGDFVKRILSAWADLLDMTERTAGNGGTLIGDEFSRLLPEITAFTERLRFNVIYRGPQKFAWADIPLAEVKTTRQMCGASVNDVILALVTATIRRYLELHGDRVKGRLLRMMVPVNLRGSDSAGELGNRISLVPVTIPLDIRNPRRLLAAVHKRTEFLKRSHAAELVSLAGGLIGMFPTPMQALAGPVLSQLPITPFNLVCTNVPGPQYPLYLLGHKMLRWYPYVPVGGEMALNCAVLSYDGKVYFGFSGDVHAAPDLRRLEEFLEVSFAELREAAGILLPRKSSRRSPKMSKKSRMKPSTSPGEVRVSIPLAVPIQPARAPSPVSEERKTPTRMIA
ncbi:MAG TPA: wax ester/triacylglycerol synthase family O-acyltransferase [Terriglobales bacterium]|nr:wax ester/triacylglycerol synthase family O-acyltransferase [Terriglobales bacterium]